MPGKDAHKLTKRSVDALVVGDKDAVFWDRHLPGFGVRVYTTGRKVYVVQTRGPGGPKRVTIGWHGEVSADKARKQATVIIDRIKRGEDPMPSEPAPEWTMADLAERYMCAHVEVNCRPSTAKNRRNTVAKYILPELGRLPIGAVNQKQVAALHYKLRDMPYQANETLNVLAKMFSLAEAWGMTPPRRNPCRAVRKYKEHRRERFLTPDEYRRLGRVLDEAEEEGSVSSHAIAAIRLLMLTGCRRNEILKLRWDEVDLKAGELRLSDSKTGPRTVFLSPEAVQLLEGLPRVLDNPWVIPGRTGGTYMRNINDPWEIIRDRAGLEDVRIHDLRHSFASRALALGESLPMIGKLLGHSQVETTARYAHLARDSVQESAARIADSIAADILGGRYRPSKT